MTKHEGIRLVAMLRSCWPRQEIKQDTAELYAAILGDLPWEEAKAAVMRLAQTTRFFPTIAEIREQVAEARCALDPPELAWGEVQKAISRVGSYQQPLFENPAIQRAVNAIGWRNICLDDNLSATRARFTDAYRAARQQQIESQTTGRALPSPYSKARLPERKGGGLEHGSYVFVGEEFPLLALEGDDAPNQLVEGLAERLRRKDDE